MMTARGQRVVRPGGPQGRPRRVMTVDGDRSAVLLVRIWLEDGAESVRGRLTSMDITIGRPGAEERAVTVASSPRGVVDAVRAWLDEFVRDAQPDATMTSGTATNAHRRQECSSCADSSKIRIDAAAGERPPESPVTGM